VACGLLVHAVLFTFNEKMSVHKKEDVSGAQEHIGSGAHMHIVNPTPWFQSK